MSDVLARALDTCDEERREIFLKVAAYWDAHGEPDEARYCRDQAASQMPVTQRLQDILASPPGR